MTSSEVWRKMKVMSHNQIVLEKSSLKTSIEKSEKKASGVEKLMKVLYKRIKAQNEFKLHGSSGHPSRTFDVPISDVAANRQPRRNNLMSRRQIEKLHRIRRSARSPLTKLKKFLPYYRTTEKNNANPKKKLLLLPFVDITDSRHNNPSSPFFLLR